MNNTEPHTYGEDGYVAVPEPANRGTGYGVYSPDDKFLGRVHDLEAAKKLIAKDKEQSS